MSTDTDPNEQPTKPTAETLERAIATAQTRQQRRTILQIANTRILIDAADRGKLDKTDAMALVHELKRRQATPQGRAQQDQAIVDIARETGKPLRLDCLSDGGAFRLLESMENPEKFGIDPKQVNEATLKAVRKNCEERRQQAKDRSRAMKERDSPTPKEKKGPRNQKPKRRR